MTDDDVGGELDNTPYVLHGGGVSAHHNTQGETIQLPAYSRRARGGLFCVALLLFVGSALTGWAFYYPGDYLPPDSGSSSTTNVRVTAYASPVSLFVLGLLLCKLVHYLSQPSDTHAVNREMQEMKINPNMLFSQVAVALQGIDVDAADSRRNSTPQTPHLTIETRDAASSVSSVSTPHTPLDGLGATSNRL